MFVKFARYKLLRVKVTRILETSNSITSWLYNLASYSISLCPSFFT